jgi:hypothetical protein
MTLHGKTVFTNLQYDGKQTLNKIPSLREEIRRKRDHEANSNEYGRDYFALPTESFLPRVEGGGISPYLTSRISYEPRNRIFNYKPYTCALLSPN